MFITENQLVVDDGSFVQNGQGFGPMGDRLTEMRFEPGLYRPYFDDKTGLPTVTVNSGYKQVEGKTVAVQRAIPVSQLWQRGINNPVLNATTLRKEEWIRLDETVIRAARLRLKAWADLVAANTYGGFNGMGVTILEHETMSDPGSAMVDMDALTDGRADRQLFQLEGLPLPITHSDFWFSERQLATSRNRGTPLDMTMAEAAGRRIGETLEQTLIGSITGLTFGGGSSTPTYGRTSKVFGYTNFTNRLTKTNMTAPTGSNPEVTVANVLAAREQLYAAKYYGPYMVYHSTDWDQYLDNDYARLGGNNANMTLRDRLRKIEGIQDVRRLDYLTSAANPFTMLFVQMTPDVARAVIGMDMTVLQWETKGGLEKHFKVMTIQVPQLRADYNGNTGILQATTS